MTSEMHVFEFFKIEKTSAIILPSLLTCLMYFVTVKSSACMLLSERLSHHLQKASWRFGSLMVDCLWKSGTELAPGRRPRGSRLWLWLLLTFFLPKTEYYIFPAIFRFDPKSHFKLPRTYTRHRCAPSPSDGLFTLGAWCNWWKEEEEDKKKHSGFFLALSGFIYIYIYIYFSGSNLNGHQNHS